MLIAFEAPKRNSGHCLIEHNTPESDNTRPGYGRKRHKQFKEMPSERAGTALLIVMPW